MDLCWQSNVSAFLYAVYVGHNFSSKEQVSFNFMAAVTICSDFEAQENKVSHCFQYLAHLMRRTDSLEKTLMLGQIEGKRRRGQQWMRWLDGITHSGVGDREAWHAAVHGVTSSQI